MKILYGLLVTAKKYQNYLVKPETYPQAIAITVSIVLF